MFFSLIASIATVVHGVAYLMSVDAAVVATSESEGRITRDVQAKVQFFIGIISAVVVPIALPVRQDADMVLALEHEWRAVGSIWIASWASYFI